MTLEECRSFYAEEIRLSAALRTPALVEAFARVPRERFPGRGPWQIASADAGLGGVTYTATEDADPRRLYHNVPVALDARRDLNNGQPGAIARWADALELKPGERVFHLGCGVGYYTAILAEVVGPQGRVVASEADRDLADRARANLSGRANVEVHAGDGALLDPGACDAILINAGVTHPHAVWLDCLREGGRIILPLTIAMGPQGSATLGKGAMVRLVKYRGRFSAGVVTLVAIYSCTSVRDPRVEPLLSAAFARGALFKMKTLRRDAHEKTDACVLHAPEVCFSAA